jgi:hypothetical protein
MLPPLGLRVRPHPLPPLLLRLSEPPTTNVSASLLDGWHPTVPMIASLARRLRCLAGDRKGRKTSPVDTFDP